MSIPIGEIDTLQQHLLRYGIENLTDEELLSVLFSFNNHKLKNNLLKSFNNINELFSASNQPRQILRAADRRLKPAV